MVSDGNETEYLGAVSREIKAMGHMLKKGANKTQGKKSASGSQDDGLNLHNMTYDNQLTAGYAVKRETIAMDNMLKANDDSPDAETGKTALQERNSKLYSRDKFVFRITQVHGNAPAQYDVTPVSLCVCMCARKEQKEIGPIFNTKTSLLLFSYLPLTTIVGSSRKHGEPPKREPNAETRRSSFPLRLSGS